MRFALALLLLAGTASAASPVLSLKGAKAEDKLRRYVTSDRTLRSRLENSLRREALFRSETRDGDLKDAVADASVDRAALVARLPGMQSPPPSSCPTLAECHVPEFAVAVDNSELLPDAVRSLVRPWMLLQQARGYPTEITPATEGDALLLVSLKGLDAAPLVLNVSPRLMGGFNVWFDRASDLAALYERERAATFLKN